MAYMSLGDHRRGSECFRSNIESLEGELIRERFGEPWIISVISRVWLVYVLAERGEFAEGSARAEEGARIAEVVDHPVSLITACRGLGHLYLRKGDLDKAIAVLERAHQLCQAWNIPTWFYGIAVFLGYAYVLSGRLADGLSLLQQAIEVGRERAAYALHATHLSEAYLLANRSEDAIRLARQAVDFARDHKRRGNQAWALRVLGEIASHRDPVDAENAEASYGQALALAEELGMRPLMAHCHLGLGKLYSRTDKRQQAQEHLSTATIMYGEMGMTYWLDRAEAALKTE